MTSRDISAYRDSELRSWLHDSLKLEVIAHQILDGKGPLKDAVYLVRRA